MWSLVFTIFVLSPVVSSSMLSECVYPPGMIASLGATQTMLGEGITSQQSFFNELKTCMKTFDSDLADVQDKAWEGFYNYFKREDEAGDPWGSTPGNYSDQSEKENILGIMIKQPCNYASSIAYYHILTEMCSRKSSGTAPFKMPENRVKAIAKAVADLAVGSSFFHGSSTRLGEQQDNTNLAVFAFLIYQTIIEPLKSESVFINHLSVTPRDKDALTLTEDISKMYLTSAVETWYGYTTDLNVINSAEALVGIVVATAFMILPAEANAVINILLNSFQIPASIQQFLNVSFIPEITTLTTSLNFDATEKDVLVKNLQSTAIKLAFAFLSLDTQLNIGDLIGNPILSNLGSLGLPVVNAIANALNSFTYYDENYQRGFSVYPGEINCNQNYDQPMWHLESSIAMLDLIYTVDMLYDMVTRALAK